MFVTYPRELFPSYTMQPRYCDCDSDWFEMPNSRPLYPNCSYNVQQPNLRMVNGRCGYPSADVYNERPVMYRYTRRPVVRPIKPALMNDNDMFESHPSCCRHGENPGKTSLENELFPDQLSLQYSDWPENSKDRMKQNIQRYRKNKNPGIPFLMDESSDSDSSEEELSNATEQCKLDNIHTENTATVCAELVTDRCPEDVTQDHSNDPIGHSELHSESNQNVTVENNEMSVNDVNTTVKTSPQEQLTVEQPNESSDVSSTLDQVKRILKETQELKEQADQFRGTRTDKQFLYLEEMLTRMLLKLDGIDSQGKEEIRLVRRQAVKTVQASLDVLDNEVHPERECNLNSQNAQKTVDMSEVTQKCVKTSDAEGEVHDCSEDEQSGDTSEHDQKGIDNS